MNAKKVLVIDDEKPARTMVVRALERLGVDSANIFQAENGRVGTDLIQKECPDLTITDLTMPEMDGWEVLAWIRDQYKPSQPQPSIKVLAMSGYVEDPGGATKRLTDAGADGFLAKPFRLETFFMVVKSLLA